MVLSDWELPHTLPHEFHLEKTEEESWGWRDKERRDVSGNHKNTGKEETRKQNHGLCLWIVHGTWEGKCPQKNIQRDWKAVVW